MNPSAHLCCVIRGCFLGLKATAEEVPESGIVFMISSVSRTKRKFLMLCQRWEESSRSRLAGVGFKPPGAASFEKAWW